MQSKEGAEVRRVPGRPAQPQLPAPNTDTTSSVGNRCLLKSPQHQRRTRPTIGVLPTQTPEPPQSRFSRFPRNALQEGDFHQSLPTHPERKMQLIKAIWTSLSIPATPPPHPTAKLPKRLNVIIRIWHIYLVKDCAFVVSRGRQTD